MEETTSREKVLKKIRNALINKTENPYPSVDIESLVYHEFEDTLDITFAHEFTKAEGKFIYCENEKELYDNLISLIAEKKWVNIFCLEPDIKKTLDNAGIPFKSEKADFTKMEAGITYCEYLIARLGSIMITSRQTSGRRLNVFPENHIVIAYTSQIVADLKDALKNIKEKYINNMPSLISVITGPSRTADIEKTLVMGAHGPKELYLFLIDEE
ncbi:MAG: lactate utilization protein [Bacteroidetes bacterium]|nr:lactate utilization protein [Bacteroidota bacterium]MBL7103458.1 lactate utilization protein [Bacteroidales bacterium]